MRPAWMTQHIPILSCVALNVVDTVLEIYCTVAARRGRWQSLPVAL